MFVTGNLPLRKSLGEETALINKNKLIKVNIFMILNLHFMQLIIDFFLESIRI